MKCNKCNGTGYNEANKDLDPIYRLLCDKCNGSGKLDWLENILGKRNSFVSPGVYIKEVDVSSIIPASGALDVFISDYTDLINEPEVVENFEKFKKLFGEPNGTD